MHLAYTIVYIIFNELWALTTQQASEGITDATVETVRIALSVSGSLIPPGRAVDS